jgi:hypothetical protein
MDGKEKRGRHADISISPKRTSKIGQWSVAKFDFLIHYASGYDDPAISRDQRQIPLPRKTGEDHVSASKIGKPKE